MLKNRGNKVHFDKIKYSISLCLIPCLLLYFLGTNSHNEGSCFNCHNIDGIDNYYDVVNQMGSFVDAYNNLCSNKINPSSFNCLSNVDGFLWTRKANKYNFYKNIKFNIVDITDSLSASHYYLSIFNSKNSLLRDNKFIYDLFYEYKLDFLSTITKDHEEKCHQYVNECFNNLNESCKLNHFNKGSNLMKELLKVYQNQEKTSLQNLLDSINHGGLSQKQQDVYNAKIDEMRSLANMLNCRLNYCMNLCVAFHRLKEYNKKDIHILEKDFVVLFLVLQYSIDYALTKLNSLCSDFNLNINKKQFSMKLAL